MKVIKLFIVLLSILIAFPCFSSDNKIAEIDHMLSQQVTSQSPGLAVAIVKDKNIIFEKGYGFANLEYNIPITPQTVFLVGSVSKQFTAMAVALLVEEGKLGLDDDLRKYLPDILNFHDPLTVRQLIYHTDGLRDQWDLLTFAGWNVYGDIVTTNDVLGLIKSQKQLNFKPGTEYLYGNTGYTLLALLVEKVSGKSFPEFCKEKIFIPLKMKDTFFNDDYRNIIHNLAHSYDLGINGKFLKCSYNVSTLGATGLYTTAEDLAKWCNNFYDPIVGSNETIKLVTTPGTLNNGTKLNYGFGIELNNIGEVNCFGHSGADAGYNAMLLCFPEKRLGIIILSNLKTINTQGLTENVAEIMLGKKVSNTIKKPDFKNLGKINSDLLKGYYHDELTGTTLSFNTEDNKLYTIIMKQKMYLSQEDFYTFKAEKFPQVNFQFIVHADGKITLIYKNELTSSTIKFTKIKAINVFTNTKDFVGNYYSPELNVTYKILGDNNTLELQRPKHSNAKLTPLVNDIFEADGGFWEFPYYVNFDRDKQNKIIGFKISTYIVTNRIRNLTFYKK